MSETDQGCCCAHLRVTWQTERVPAPNVRGEIVEGLGTRGWWACAACGAAFGPAVSLAPEFRVVAGPGPLAYELSADALTVYVGAGIAAAPDAATQATIADGFSTWVMRAAPSPAPAGGGAPNEGWFADVKPPTPDDLLVGAEPPKHLPEYRHVLNAVIHAGVPNGTTGAIEMVDALVRAVAAGGSAGKPSVALAIYADLASWDHDDLTYGDGVKRPAASPGPTGSAGEPSERATMAAQRC
jgi:hypothetical protein